ncbi:MAG: sigma-70 family RNA polymerase sigma factor [Acidobacteria bacterium]|uniref:Sigma-70 family RNA polymerase sigma factor n=1 Tax=Candidatus Polarisedimenticola svalbardensis TaxID=2886004 RepID=A0A8J7CKF2_9BACT|nr:sigma-70 family RNA polymerase sigma factor [Candidatus Polarisedimenticola svalbardensis]
MQGPGTTTGKAGLGRTAGERQATDETLVHRCLNGNRSAFEKLVRRHQKGLVNHLYRLTGQPDTARDLAQEVFIKVYTSLGTFDPRYRFTTWMYRIASNCAIDHLRKRRPQTCSLTVQAAESDDRSQSDREFAGTEPTPHQMLRCREIQERLEASVEALPSSYRQLILLRHQKHCRYDEIARITGLPIGTVKNRIFRAREILRSQLSDILEAEDLR